MKVHLSLGDNGNLIALLDNGERILAADSQKMAEQLRLAGVTADSITVTDWKTDPNHAPASGTIIAVKAALRGLPPKSAAQIAAIFEQHGQILKMLADSDTESEE